MLTPAAEKSSFSGLQAFKLGIPRNVQHCMILDKVLLNLEGQLWQQRFAHKAPLLRAGLPAGWATPTRLSGGVRRQSSLDMLVCQRSAAPQLGLICHTCERSAYSTDQPDVIGLHCNFSSIED